MKLPLTIQFSPKQYKAINNLYIRSQSKLQPNEFILALVKDGLNTLNEKIIVKTGNKLVSIKGENK